MRIYYRQNRKLRYTTLPVRGYSVISPPGASVHFQSVDGKCNLHLLYRHLTAGSQKRLPLPDRVQQVIAEQLVLWNRKGRE